ncbi:hypothetical protein BJY04DRAFT_201620, partial [Aspergillus karnatakaensis]|uniref:uncharacterized protein n=1 Tax=Aspergillus karnatakaensis TaxID=1810916 RepID=UPI003CCCC144
MWAVGPLAFLGAGGSLGIGARARARLCTVMVIVPCTVRMVRVSRGGSTSAVEVLIRLGILGFALGPGLKVWNVRNLGVCAPVDGPTWGGLAMRVRWVPINAMSVRRRGGGHSICVYWDIFTAAAVSFRDFARPRSWFIVV